MNNDLPQAILFDLDDTILADSESADLIWRRICRKVAPRVDGQTPEGLFEAIEAIRTWFWADADRHRRGRLNLRSARREIVSRAFRQLRIDDPDLVIEVSDAYTSEREDTVAPFPGAIETLRILGDKGVRLGMITNGAAEGQRRKIDKFGLSDFFSYILVEGEFGVGKPDGRVYLQALKKLGVAPTDSWMAGDNLEWDVEAPQRLGIYAIWVDFEGKGLPESTHVVPDRIVTNISQILKR